MYTSVCPATAIIIYSPLHLILTIMCVWTQQEPIPALRRSRSRPQQEETSGTPFFRLHICSGLALAIVYSIPTHSKGSSQQLQWYCISIFRNSSMSAKSSFHHFQHAAFASSSSLASLAFFVSLCTIRTLHNWIGATSFSTFHLHGLFSINHQLSLQVRSYSRH